MYEETSLPGQLRSQVRPSKIFVPKKHVSRMEVHKKLIKDSQDHKYSNPSNERHGVWQKMYKPVNNDI